MARPAREENVISFSCRGYSATAHEGTEGSFDLPLERVPYPAEDRRRASVRNGIANPRGARGQRRADVMHEHEIQRHFAADRGAEPRRGRRPVPGTPGIEKAGAVNRPQKDWPGSGATLHTRDRQPEVDIDNRGTRSGHVVRSESAEQSNRFAAEIEDEGRRSGS